LLIPDGVGLTAVKGGMIIVGAGGIEIAHCNGSFIIGNTGTSGKATESTTGAIPGSGIDEGNGFVGIQGVTSGGAFPVKLAGVNESIASKFNGVFRHVGEEKAPGEIGSEPGVIYSTEIDACPGALGLLAIGLRCIDANASRASVIAVPAVDRKLVI